MNSGQRPKAGWVYKAFQEKYTFPDEIKKANDKKELDAIKQDAKHKEQERIEKEKNKQEIKQHQQEFEKVLEKKIIAGKLERNLIEDLWKDAKEKVDPKSGRKNVVAKMNFCKMLIEQVNAKGYSFRTDITPPGFAKKIADKLELK